MKKMIAIAALTLFLVSCKKEPTSSTPAADLVSTVKFTANGTNYEIIGCLDSSDNGSLLMGYGFNTEYYYTLAAADTLIPRTTFGFILNTTTLTAKSYSFGYPFPAHKSDCQIKGVGYGYTNFWERNDNTIVTISNIHDGVADGTFSGQLPKSSNYHEKMTITNGVFNNVKIRL